MEQTFPLDTSNPVVTAALKLADLGEVVTGERFAALVSAELGRVKRKNPAGSARICTCVARAGRAFDTARFRARGAGTVATTADSATSGTATGAPLVRTQGAPLVHAPKQHTQRARRRRCARPCRTLPDVCCALQLP